MNQQHSLSHEDMLIALDQLDQTVEVMSQIIRRLKQSIDQPTSSQSAINRPQEAHSNSLLHTDVSVDATADQTIEGNLH